MAYRYISLVGHAEKLVQRHVLDGGHGLPRAFGRQLTSYIKHFADSPNSSLSRLFNEWRTLRSDVPKGFEKFFPGGKKPAPKPEEAAKAESAKAAPKEAPRDPPSRSSGGTSKGSDKKFEFSFDLAKSKNIGDPNDPSSRLLFGVVTGVTIVGLLALYSGQYREITWKEFLTNFLSRGVVEKLEVVNKKWVRLKMVPGTQVDTGTIWFNIGSVEAFERSIESAQLEMNIEPANFVSVVYKTETEIASLVGSALNIIIPLAFIFWLIRRSSAGMMGGGAGGRPGAGGRSGAGGIFGFGQTTAKKKKVPTATLR